MADFTVHPVAGQTVSSSEFSEHMEKRDALAARVHDVAGGAFDQSSAGLTLTIQPGVAFIRGRDVGDTTDAAVAKALTGNATNHVFLDRSGAITVNTSGVPPTDSIKLWEIVTNASVVTGATDFRDETVRFDAPFSAESLVSDGSITGGAALKQTAVQPYHEWKDTSGGGDTFRIWNRNGKLQLTDESGSTVHVDDLATATSPVDETDTDATKDKSVSNLLAKGWQDTKTTVDAAVAAPTASAIIKRDGSGRAQVAAPSAAADIARKDTVDAVQTNLTSHEGAADPHTQYILADGTRAFTAAQSMGGFKLTNLAAPTANNDAVRKSYVDATVADINVKLDLFLLGGM